MFNKPAALVWSKERRMRGRELKRGGKRKRPENSIRIMYIFIRTTLLKIMVYGTAASALPENFLTMQNLGLSICTSIYLNRASYNLVYITLTGRV